MEDARRGVVTTGGRYPRATLSDVRAHQAAVAREVAIREARAKKVAILLALVPAAASDVEANALARELASWDQARRDTFAAAAGCNSPSESTWALLCTKVRA